MGARDEAKPERPYLALDGRFGRIALDYFDAIGRHSRTQAKRGSRPGPEDRRPRTASDFGHVEHMIEMGVAHDDGVRARDVARDGRRVGAHATQRAPPEGRAGHVRINEQDLPRMFEREARRAQPSESDFAGCDTAGKGSLAPSDVLRTHGGILPRR